MSTLKGSLLNLLIAVLLILSLISTPVGAVEVKRIEDSDPSFKYSDVCEIQKNPGASGGSWLACPAEGKPPAPGTKTNIKFFGTAVSVIHLVAPGGGIVKVQIDGRTYPEINMNSQKIAFAKTEIASSLINSNHTLTLELTNGVMVIDAIEVSEPTNGVTIEETAPTPATTSDTSGQSSKSASVSLHGEKTDVVLGEDILLKLSAVNLITKPKMHVQVIIIPPSGMSVTSSEFSKSGAGQFTANYELEPGDGKDVEVRIKSNQVGDFNVNGRVVYYFGDEKDKAEDYNLNLPIKVRKEPIDSAQNMQKVIPGFTPIFAIIGLLATAYFFRNRR